MPPLVTMKDTSLIDAKLEALPTRPGCYLFIDGEHRVVYVGKAKSLRSRVRSYFHDGSDTRYFIPILRDVVTDLETVVTTGEKEAAILENDLIKQHKPRFNVKLRDDKDFLCLRLDASKSWPMLETVRRPKPDGARYFGPFHSATSARRTLHVVNKHFQLRTCSDAELASRTRPCLQYQIKRCLAPCVFEVDKSFYAEMVKAVTLFLEGRHDELTQVLEDRMRKASEAMEYERATIYRNQLRAAHEVRETQRVVTVKDVDQDVVGLHREGPLAEVLLLLVRAGHVNETLSFSLREVEVPDEEVLAAFFAQYYGAEGGALLPDEILVPILPDGVDGIAEWLSDRRGRKVQLVQPKRGPRADLLRMAQDNAAHAFAEKRRAADDIEARLEALRGRLRLPTTPHRIECCDISHSAGRDTVGAVVSLRNGEPDKKRYRSFHVKRTEGGDDYGAMYEVLARRFRRARSTGKDAKPDDADWDLPDLFVVDGGKGQLNVALSAARELGLHSLPIVGLAKERESATGEKMVDRVYLVGQKNGVLLRPSSSELFLLARARDEAHRFANHVRERLANSRRYRSEIDDLRGVGKTAKRMLLRELGSVEALHQASDDQILAVTGITRRHLVAIRRVISGP